MGYRGRALERRTCREQSRRTGRPCTHGGRYTCSCQLRLCKMHLDYHRRNLSHHEQQELRGV